MGIHKDHQVKVLMTTALDDETAIAQSFEERCDAYLVKPIYKKKLLEEVQLLGLISGKNTDSAKER